MLPSKDLRPRSHPRTGRLAVVICLLAPAVASAQTADDAVRFRLPQVEVNARKEPTDKQDVPVSVTAVPQATIEAAGVRVVSDAAIFAPNTYFTDWSARKLSNARFRGISSSPNNPGITTYVDGVPQLNANTSSLELLDVEQIEFVRGPQSALFGRNTLGGLVNVNSAMPSVSRWTGEFSGPFGTHDAWGVRGGVSGPLVPNTLSLGISVAHLDRDGFTVNDTGGKDIDSRSAFSSKAQLLWVPSASWEARVIFSSERARDGDYSLHDVGALRDRPFHASRDFEGRADRDVYGTTIIVRHSSPRLTFTSTTGFVDWRTQDVTDLDYTSSPVVTRDNTETALQFTQELRVASSENASILLGEATRLRWQAGVFFFDNGYEQDAINTYAPFVFGPAAISQHSPRSALDDLGIGVFGQATFTVRNRLDLAAGVRVDYEDKSATLESFFDPPDLPGSRFEADETFSNVSPQVSATYRMRPDRSLYATVSRGYKAGGFNPASPSGREAYGEEFSTNVEGGIKTLWANGRVSANAAVFFIDWDDLQLNIPNPQVPAQFFIANVGRATSRGAEVEVAARVAPGLEAMTAFGYTDATFREGSVSSGVNVENNRISNTPEYTYTAGLQYTKAAGAIEVQARGDAVFYGDFFYNDQNSLAQEDYSLVNVRLAVTGRFFLGEVLVRNALDTRYIPLAFPYPSFAPSGFVGEMGAPRTVTFRAGVRF